MLKGFFVWLFAQRYAIYFDYIFALSGDKMGKFTHLIPRQSKNVVKIYRISLGKQPNKKAFKH